MVLPPYTVIGGNPIALRIDQPAKQHSGTPVYCVRATSLIPTGFSTTCAEGEGALEEGVEADALPGSCCFARKMTKVHMFNIISHFLLLRIGDTRLSCMFAHNPDVPSSSVTAACKAESIPFTGSSPPWQGSWIEKLGL